MMTKTGSNKIVTFMTRGVGLLVLWRGHISHIVKLYYFFKNILLYFQAYIRQTMYIVMMTKKGSTKIATFTTPGAWVLVLRWGHIRHIAKMHYFFKNLLLYFQA